MTNTRNPKNDDDTNDAEESLLDIEMESGDETLSAMRAWVASDVPGLARADAVDLAALLRTFPSANQAAAPAATIIDAVTLRNQRSQRARRWWQTAAAAALLCMGFAIGRVSGARQNVAGPSLAYAYVAENANQTGAAANLPSITPSNGPSTVKQNLSLADMDGASAPVDHHAIAQPSPRPATRHLDENGRLVIETALSSGGGQATWVIDGGFKLNEPEIQRTSEIAPSDAH